MSTRKKANKKPHAILNRRASFDYALGNELTVGVVLRGNEVRAARDGRVQLKGSFVTIRGNELWLNNASFTLKQAINQGEQHTVDTSPRKLLASRHQINQLAAQKQEGMSIVPLRLLTAGRFIKLVIAVGKGKKRYDKRQVIKQRDQERDIRRSHSTHQ